MRGRPAIKTVVSTASSSQFIVRTRKPLTDSLVSSLFINCYFCIEALGQQLSIPSLCPLFLNVFPSGVPVPTRNFKPKHPNLAAFSVEDRQPARPLSTWCPAHPHPNSSCLQSMCLEGICPARPLPVLSPLFGGICDSELLYFGKMTRLE